MKQMNEDGYQRYILSLAVARATKGWTIRWITATERERRDASDILKRAGIKLPKYRKPSPMLKVVLPDPEAAVGEEKPQPAESNKSRITE